MAREPEADRVIPRGQADVVLVVPASATVVEFAHDIVQLRPLLLIAYDERAVTNVPVVHIWDPRIPDWVRMSSRQFVTGSIFDRPPCHVVVVGPDRWLPPGMDQKPSWAQKVTRLPQVDLVALVNVLNEVLAFTPKEWRMLADTYGFKLRDLNEERRRWGRYGRPGSKRAAPLPPVVREEERAGSASETVAAPMRQAPEAGGGSPAAEDK